MLCTLTWKTAAAGILPPDFRSPLTDSIAFKTDTTKPLINKNLVNRLFSTDIDTIKLPGKDSLARKI